MLPQPVPNKFLQMIYPKFQKQFPSWLDIYGTVLQQVLS